MRARRVVVATSILLLVAALVALALRPVPLPVEVAEAVRGPFEVTVDEEGHTRVRERFVVSAPVAGELQRVTLEAGDPIERGQPVATILPAPPTPLDRRTRAELEERLRGAEASLRSAEAARSFAEAELARARRLAESGALARRSLEDAEVRAEAAARQVDEARAIARALRAQLGRGDGGGLSPIELLAPASGSILRIHQESATVVAPGTPILEIGDPSDLEVVTDLLSEEAVAIPAGAPVLVERWGGPKPLRGKVRRVEPSAFTKISALGVEEQRVNVVIDLVDPPEERRGLGDRYRVVTRIVTFSTDDATTVPTGALFRDRQGWRVFVVEEGTARIRSVRIGQRSPQRVQILEGLAPGERVILYPGERIADGAKVAPTLHEP